VQRGRPNVHHSSNADNLMGTPTVRITWSAEGPGKWIPPLLGGGAFISADIATGRTDATRSVQCTEA
jgi:hypothetical protein